MPSISRDVSVVIVSYNTRDLLTECLRSVYRETQNLDLEVIVVDNASVDGSARMVQEEFSEASLIVNPENIGFAQATNLGIDASVGRYVLLLNPDTVILDRAIEHMVGFMDRHPKVGACGSRLVYPDGTFQRSFFPLPSLIGGIHLYSALFERIHFLGRIVAAEWIDPQPDRSRPVGYCSGACLLVSRRCLEEVGNLDGNYFLYTEEVDWCRRMWKAGWQVYYLAEAAVVHYLGASQTELAGGIRRLRQLSSDLYYLSKWHGKLYAYAYWAVVWICSCYRYFKRHWSLYRGRARPEELADDIAFHRAILVKRSLRSPWEVGQAGKLPEY